MDASAFDSVLVIDYGAQYAQLIARRVRECKVFSEILPHDVSVEEIRKRRPRGLILSGGPSSVYADGAPAVNPEFFQLGIPVLGICYGLQGMAQALGGEVAHTGTREYGKTDLRVSVPGSTLFRGLPEEQTVWMSHGDVVVRAPDGFRVTAGTESSPVAAFEDPARGLYGVQFHPEVAHTPRGTDLLKNFLYEACDARPSWTHVSIIEEAVAEVRARVGDNKIICGLSGGVDSAVAAVLVHKAVGDNLTCVFVDHGLMRKDEAEQVEETFRRLFHINLIHVKAQDRFLAKLEGVTDPERKRKAIGEEFIRVFEEIARNELAGARFLVQGTLYPDIIESGTRDAAKIKSHHNVGGLPEDMDFELVEPLRNLFKDEVRAIGEELGLPDEITWRQPFPGPGLAIRVIGDVTHAKLEVLRNADAVVLDEVRKAGMLRELWQSFAILPDVRTVGVMGDERSYEHPIVIRAVTSEDAMTADWARLPYELLERMASRIIAEVPGVNRVAYDITSKPPGTIEWE
ncbi:MAG TPA: glutamine-hydrolyzing GMP synthase [Actinomycetota bacterium]|nr:glutamine-hydrolyzing GMP synthase [Actinomycetota bacterium]